MSAQLIEQKTRKHSRLIGQVLRFGVVGVGNTTLTLSVIYLCLFLFGLHDALSNIIGYLFGLAFGFTFNRKWTFQSRIVVWKGFLRYASCFAVAYAVNLSLVLLLRQVDLSPAIAHAAGMPAYTITFFLLTRFLVFAD